MQIDYTKPGLIAQQGNREKRASYDKHFDLAATRENVKVITLSFETMGPTCEETKAWLKHLAEQYGDSETPDSEQLRRLRQLLSTHLQVTRVRLGQKAIQFYTTNDRIPLPSDRFDNTRGTTRGSTTGQERERESTRGPRQPAQNQTIQRQNTIDSRITQRDGNGQASSAPNGGNEGENTRNGTAARNNRYSWRENTLGEGVERERERTTAAGSGMHLQEQKDDIEEEDIMGMTQPQNTQQSLSLSLISNTSTTPSHIASTYPQELVTPPTLYTQETSTTASNTSQNSHNSMSTILEMYKNG
jgi:hypothetical protein